MIKKLELLIEHTCRDCPYFEVMAGGDYNDEYYYCCNPMLDISDRWATKTICEGPEIGEYQYAYRQYLESKKTLFPICEKELPTNPSNIPEWCPLPNAD